MSKSIVVFQILSECITHNESMGLVPSKTTFSFKKFVKTRSTSPQVGTSNDAILSRAEHSLKNGDIEKALKELDQLPLDLQNEMRDWYKKAKNHLEINNAMNKLIYFHTD